MNRMALLTILLFITSVTFSQGLNEMNKVFLIGQVTNSLNGAPIKDQTVVVCSDSVYNPDFQYTKKLYTDHEGYYYDTIITSLNKGGLVVYTQDYLNVYHDTTVYFRFNWGAENTLFANFILSIEPPSIIYQANFYYQRNPSGQNKMEFQFHDITNSNDVIFWQWNFGDGNFSNEPNPSHIYAKSGMYRAKLTVKIQPTPSSIPYESSMVKILCVEDKSYYSMGGHVMAGYFPIDKGEAYLYKIDEQEYTVIDTAIFNDSLGYYLFPQVIEGIYIVKADLHPTSVLFNQFMTTYYSNKPVWTEADTIFHNANNFEYDIDLIPVASSITGPGIISGTILYGSDAGPQKGQPAVNIEILLFDEYNQPLVCCHSDINGEFFLEDVTLSSYQVHAEVTGKYTYPVTVSINITNPEVNDIILTIGNYAVNGNVFAIEDIEWSTISNPYPNPASDFITIDLRVIESSELTFTIYNNTGQLIYQTTNFLTSGSNNIRFDIQSLPEGVYYLKIVGHKDYLSKKFIKR
ncbi:MAG: T9SS type A sorting domain-containing protein [Bacteroidales bacterium]|nr:T9SS type A sorting domain-containing protein [Bacteroidales bacterium]